MNELKALEHPTLKVPYEVLNKKYRQAQRIIDMEARQVAQASVEIDQSLAQFDAPPPVRHVESLLGGMADKLATMKRKASEAISEEVTAGCVCKRRLDHLKEFTTDTSEAAQASMSQWRKTRLDRMLVEFLLCNGYYRAANELADKTSLRDLTNVDIYSAAAEVEEQLGRRQTARCLQWCADNKSKLRKLNSNIEFKIRIQEFIELVREDKRLDAVKYAKKHLSNYEEGQLPEIQQCMGMLAFPKDTDLEPYRSLLDTSRWSELMKQFRWEHARLLHPALYPPLTIALQVGLAALKTPQCYQASTKVASCPVCHPPLNELAHCLPHAHCSNSRLICRISGDALNEHNQPMVLPNGQVYGEKALNAMMKEHGAIICPITKEVFCMKRVEKVFVM